MKFFCYNVYPENERLTVGNEIHQKKFQINGNTETLQIWDLGGEEEFRCILPGYIKGSVGALLGFDMRRRKSFLDLPEWITMIRKHSSNIPLLLVATKADLGYHPILNSDIALQFAKDNSLVNFIEISSKNNDKIDLPFRILIQHIKDCELNQIKFLNE